MELEIHISISLELSVKIDLQRKDGKLMECRCVEGDGLLNFKPLKWQHAHSAYGNVPRVHRASGTRAITDQATRGYFFFKHSTTSRAAR